MAKDIRVKLTERIWNKIKYRYEDEVKILPLNSIVTSLDRNRVLAECDNVTMLLRDFDEETAKINIGKTFFPGKISGMHYAATPMKLNLVNLQADSPNAKPFKVDYYIYTESHGLWHVSQSFFYADPWQELRWFSNRKKIEIEADYKAGKKVFENYGDGYSFSNVNYGGGFVGKGRLTIMDPLDFRMKNTFDNVWG